MEGKIVFEGKSEKGTPIIFRYPTRDDTQVMWEYINTLSKEQTFILFQGEEITFEYEAKFLQELLVKIENKKSIHLHVFVNTKLIGISGIDMKDRASAHEGVLGITIAKEYRNEGIGKKFMEVTLEEAKKNLPQLKIVTLGVFGNNTLAYEMYQKFGFKEYGRLPQGILHKGKYVDHIYMYKNL